MGLRSASEIHERDMGDPDYRREYERTRFANAVAIQVVRYRAEHELSQTALARLLGWNQSRISSLEAADHEPSLSTLAHLSTVLGLDLSITISPGVLELAARADGT